MSISASAAAALTPSSVTTPVAVSDTAANVATNLNALASLATASKLASIGLTDSGTPLLTVTSAQFAADQAALLTVTGTYSLAVTGTLTAAAAAAASTALTAKLGTGLAVSDTMADVAANLTALETLAKAGKLASIVLTDTGTPTLTVSAPQLVINAAALVKITSAFNITVSGSATAAQAGAANPTLVAKMTAPFTVVDSAANVVTNLANLQIRAAAGKLGSITLTDSGTPSLALTVAQFGADAAALGKITGNFTLAVSGTATAAQAAAGSALAARLSAGLAVSDTAANVAAALNSLQTLVAAGKLASVALTDTGTPALAVTAAQLVNDSAALLKIGGTYSVTASGTATAAQAIAANATLAAKLTAGLAVSDTAANVAANLAALQTDAARIASVAFTDTGSVALTLTAAQLTADATILLKVTGTYGITASGSATAAQAAGINATLLAKLTAGLAVSDTAANVGANIAALQGLGTKLASVALTDAGTPTVSVTAAQLAADSAALLKIGGTWHLAVASGALTVAQATAVSATLTAKLTGGLSVSDTLANVSAGLTGLEAMARAGTLGAIALTDAGTPTLTVTAPQLVINAAALVKITSAFNITVSGSATAAQAGAANPTLVAKMTAPFTVVDSAANVVTNLPNLQIRAAAGKLASVTLSDTGTPTLGLTIAQLTADATALLKIGGSYAIAVPGPLTVAQAAAVNLTLAAKLTAGIAVADTAASALASLDALQALAGLGKLASVAFSDSGTPAIALTAATLAADAGALAAVTSAYALSVSSGTFTAAQVAAIAPAVAAKLAAGFAVSDSAANVAGDIASLQARAATIAGIALTDASPVLTLTAALLVADATVLLKVAGSYAIAVSGTATAAQATAANSTLTANLTAGIAVSDTAANVSANLDGLQVLAAAGQLASVTLTDPGTPTVTATIAQALADSTALLKIADPWSLTVTSTGITAAQANGLNSTLAGKLLTGLAVSDTLADVSAGLLGLRTLATAGKIASIALTDNGTPVLTITVPYLIIDAPALLKITGSYAIMLTGTASAAQANAADPDLVAKLISGFTVSDTAANVATYISGLQARAAAGTLSSITLTDSGIPALGLTVAQLTADATALLTIVGTYGITVSGTATVAQATAADATLAARLTAGLAVSDTAASVAANIDALQALGSAVASIALTDGGTPAMSLTAAQAAADSAALLKISSAYAIAVYGTATVAQATAFNAALTAKLAGGLAISDTAAAVTAGLDALQALQAAGHLASITLTDTGTPVLSVAATAVLADSAALALIADPWSLSVTGSVTAAQAIALNATVAAHVSGGIAVADTAANVAASLAALQALGGNVASVALSGSPATFAVTADALWHDPGILAKIATGGAALAADTVNAATAAAAANLSGAPSYTGALLFADTVANVAAYLDNLQALATASHLGGIALTDTGTPTLTVTATQLVNDGGALALTGGNFSITVSSGTLTAAQAVAISAGVRAHLAAAVAVRDTSANVVANLDALQARLPAIASVTFSNGTPTLSVAAATLSNDIGVLALATGYNLSVSGTLSAAQATALSGSVVASHLTTSAAVSDTAANVAANLSGLMALTAAGKLGSISLTDSAALTVTPDQLVADTSALRKIAGSYTLATSAALTADQAANISTVLIAHLSSSLAVSDTAAAVAADLDSLQVLASGNHLGSVALTDAGTPVLNVTSDQLTSDTAAIGKITGSFQELISGSLTAAQAAYYASHQSQLAGAVSIVDSAAAVQGAIAGLESLAANGLLTSIAFTDSGTPALTLGGAAFAASAAALGTIAGSYTVTLSGALTVAQAGAAGTAGLLAFVPAGVAIADTAANVQAALDALRLLGGSVTAIALTDPGTPAVSVTAASLLANAAVLALISGTYGLTVASGTVTAAQIEAIPAGVIAHLTAGLAVSDTAANISAAINAMQDLGGAVASIALTDASPVLTLSETQFSLTTAALLKVSGSFGITLFGLIVSAEVAAFDTTLVARFTSGIAVTDSAANVGTYLDALQTVAAAGKLGSVTLTDGTAPTISVTAATLIADSAALAAIGGTWNLAVSSGTVTAARAAALSAAVAGHLTGGLAVSDSAANIAGSLPALAGASVASIALTDAGTPVLTLTAAQLVANAAVLSLVTSGYGLTVASGTVSVAQILALPAGVTAHLTAGLAVADNAADVAAAIDALQGLGSAVGAIALTDAGPSLALTSAQIVADAATLGKVAGSYAIALTGTLTVANAATVQSLLAQVAGGAAISDTAANVQAALDTLQGYGAAVASVALTDSTTPTLTVTAATLLADAAVLAKVTSAYSLTVSSGTVTAAQALALSSAVSAHLAAGLSVSDTAAGIAAVIGALGATVASIALTDAGTPSLVLTSAQLVTDAASLGKIAGSYAIALTGDLTVAQAVAAHTQGLLAMVTGGAAISDIAANIQAALGTLQAYGTEVGAIALTDSGTPSIAVTASVLAADAGALAKIAGNYAIALTGGLTVAQAQAVQGLLGLVTGGATVADTAANVQAALDWLQAHGTPLASVSLTDAGTPTVTVTAATLIADAGILAMVAGTWNLAVASDTVTVAQALGLSATVAAHLTAGLAVSDSAANVSASIDGLEAAVATIGPIALTDAGTPTLTLAAAQLVADQAVLALVTSGYNLTVASGTVTVAQALALPAGIAANLTAGLAVSDTAANVGAALDTIPASVASIALTDASPALAMAAAQFVADQATLLKVNGNYQISLTGALTVAQLQAATGNGLAAHIAAAIAVTDTAANVQAALDALQGYGGAVSGITLTDAGTPNLSLAAATINADLATLRKIGSAFTLTVASGTFSASQAATFPAGLLAALTGPVTVADTQSGVAAVLPQLTARAASLAQIVLTDSQTDAFALTGAQFVGDGAALALLANPNVATAYSVTLTGTLTVAQATAANTLGTLASVTGGAAIADTASNVAAGLGAILALGAQVASVALTDSGTPTITLDAATAVADQAALAKIGGTWNLAISSGGVTADQAAGFSAAVAAHLTAGLPVSDSASALLADLDALETKISTIGAVTDTDGTLTASAAQIAADAGVLAQFTGAWTLTVGSGAFTAAQAAALPSGVSAHLTAGLPVSDTAADLVSAIAGLEAVASTIGPIALTDSGTPSLALTAAQLAADPAPLQAITGGFAIALTGTLTVAQAATAHTQGLLAKVTGGAAISDTAANVQAALDTLQGYGAEVASIALTDLTTPTITVTAASLVADAGALAMIGGTWNLAVSSGTVTAAQATGLGGAVTAHLTAGLAVSDTAADVSGAIDGLQALGGTLASIALSDAGTPAVALSAAQLIADAAALLKITSSHGLTVSGTATAAQAATVNATLAAALTAGLAVSDSAASVVAGLDGLQALYAAGKLASIALTDAGTPVLSVTAAALNADLGALSTVTGSYSLAVASGFVTAAQAATLNAAASVAAHVTSSVSVQDLAANVAAHVTDLAGLGSALSSIALTDAGVPTLSLTAAQLVADSAVWLKIAGTYAITVSNTATAAQATGANATLLGLVAGGLSVSDTASNIGGAIDALQGLGGAVASIALTDAGTPAVTVTAAQLVADSATLLKISSAHAITVSGTATAQQAATANATLVGLLSAGLAVSDSAANVAAYLDGLQALFGAGKLASIALTGATTVTATAATLVADAGALAMISGSWTLTVSAGTVTVAQALAISPSVTAHLSAGLAVSDTAANVTASLDALQGLGATVASIALTDASPAISVSAATLAADQATLLKIGGPLALTVTGTATADQAGYAANLTIAGELTAGISVSDSAAGVVAGLPGLVALNLAGKLSAIALTDAGTPAISLAAATIQADAAVLALIGGNWNLTATSGTFTAAQATALSATVTSHLTSGMAIADSAANVSSNLAALQALGGKIASVALSGSPATFAVTADQLWQDPGILGKVITGGAALVGDGSNAASAASASHLSGAPAYTGTLLFADTAANVTTYLSNLQDLATAGNLGGITLTDAGTPVISLTAGQLIADSGALALTGGSWSIAITSGTVTAAQALAIGSTVLSHLTGALPVRDTSANIVSNLDALQARAAHIASVAFSNGTPTLSLTGTKITGDIGVLELASGYSLSLSGTLTAAQAAAIAGTAVVSHFTVGPAISDLTANIAGALPALLSLANAGKLGAITPTDSTALTVTPGDLTTDLSVLRKITTAYTLGLSAALTADQAIGVNSLLVAHLPSNLAVTDSSANVLADLDSLQVMAAAGHLGTVNLTDTGTPVLAVTADQMTSDAAVLAEISGSYQIAIQGGITAAQATQYAADTSKLAGGINVVDSAADVSANMPGLETLAALGLISSIAFTDSGTPDLTLTGPVFAASFTALAAIVGSYQVTLTGTLTVAQAAAASGAGLLAVVPAGIAVGDTAANVQAALDTLQGYGAAVSSIALSDAGTPTVTVSAATLLADAAALGMIGGTWNLTVASGTVTLAQALALAPALTAHLTAGLAVSDTAGEVNANLSGLLAMGAALGSIALTDASPVLTLAAADMVTYAATLLKIGGSYGISLSGTATAAQAAAFNATLVGKLTAGMAVSDLASAVTTNLDALQARATAGKLGSVTLTDAGTPTITASAATVIADAGALALTGGTWHLTVSSGTVLAADAAGLGAGVTAHLTAGMNVVDSAANVTASLDGLTAQGPAVAQIALTDAGTPALALSAATLNAEAATLLKIQTAYSISLTGALTVAQAASLQTDGLLALVTGGAAISDTAANVQAGIDALQADGSGIASVALTDAATPTITLTAAQVIADQAALLKIGSAFNLTVSSGTVTIAQLEAFSPVLAAHLTAGFTVSDTTANLTAQLVTLATQNLVLGANPALGSIALTDAGTPTLTITQAQLGHDGTPLSLVTTPFSIALTGNITAANQNSTSASLLAKVTGGVHVADNQSQIQANFQSLERNIAWINAITLTDPSTPTFSVAASDLVLYPDAVALIGGSWNLTVASGTFTAAQAVALPAAATAHLTAGVAVSDTAAQVSGNFSALAAMGGALGSIALTDASPSLSLTSAQFAADTTTLQKVSGSYAIALSGALTAAQAVTAGNAGLLQLVSGGAAISDSAAAVQADMGTLSGFGSAVASVALTDAGTPTISTDVAGLLGNAALLAKVSGTWSLDITAGTVTAGQSLALPAATTAHLSAGLALSDLAANVTGNLAALQALGGVIATIAFSDAGTPALALTSDQLVTYGTLLAKTGGSGFTITLTGALTVARAASLQTDGLLALVTGGAAISDTAANVQAGIDALQADGSGIASVALTDAATPTITLTAAQVIADQAALLKIGSAFNLTVSSGTVTIAQLEAFSPVVAAHLTAGFTVSDTAANFTAQIDTLNTQNLVSGMNPALGSIVLTDAGTPSIALTSHQFEVDDYPLTLITSPYTIAVTDNTTAANQNPVPDEIVAKVSPGLNIHDNQDQTQANLSSLQRHITSIASITLTDPSPPTFSVTASDLVAYSDVLAMVGGEAWSLTVTSGTFTAAQAVALPAAVAANLTAGLNVSDSAAHVTASLGGLQTLQSAGHLASIALTDPGTPTVSTGAAAIIADQGALAMIGGTWNLTASGGTVTADQAKNLTASVASHLTAGLNVSDSASAVSADLDALQAAGATVGSIALTDAGTPALSMTAAQLANDSATLIKVAGSFSITVTSGTLTVAQAQAANSNGLLALVTGGAAINDNYGNIQSNLDALQAMGAKVASIALNGVGGTTIFVVSPTLVADPGALLKIGGSWSLYAHDGAITAAQAVAIDPSLIARLTTGVAVSDTAAGVSAAIDSLQSLGSAVRTIGLTDAGTPTVSVTSGQLIADSAALLLITGSFAIAVSGTLAVADVETAHGNGLLASVTGGAAISDAAATVQAALDTLQGYGAAIGSVALTDAGTPTVSVSTATLVADAGILAKIGGTWDLSVASGTIAASDAAALPAPVLSHLTTPLHVTGGETLMDQLQGIESSIADITLGTSTTVISMTAGELVADAPVLGKVTNLYQFNVTSGSVTAAQAVSLNGAGLLGLVNGGIPVSDTAAQVQANLGALQGLGAEVSQISLSDAGTPVIGVSAATFVADGGALARITSGYALTVTSGTFLAADAVTLPTGPLQHLTAGINVQDTGAQVGTHLDGLETLAANGDLGSVALSDSGTVAVTAAQVVADTAALAAMTGTWSLSVSSGTFTAAQAAALVTDGLAAHLTGTVALHDTTAHMLAYLGTLQALSGAGSLGALAVTTSPSAINVTAAQATNDASAVNALLGATGSNANAELFINGTTGGDTVDSSVFSRAMAVSLNGNAATMTFVGAAATVNGSADSLTLGSAATTVEAPMGSGTEVVQGFQFGTDILEIALGSGNPANLELSDVTLGGQSSVAIKLSTDPTHGILLVNPGLSASAISSDYMFTAGTHVIIG